MVTVWFGNCFEKIKFGTVGVLAPHMDFWVRLLCQWMKQHKRKCSLQILLELCCKSDGTQAEVGAEVKMP